MHSDQLTALDDPATCSPGPEPTRSWWTGRSGLVVAALVLALAIYLTAGIVTMEIPAGAKAPGPTFVPILLAICCYVLAVLLAVQVVRSPQVSDPDDQAVDSGGRHYRTHTDWKALGTALIAFCAFTVLLVPVGWIISAALLFWLVARALGSTRPLFDLGLALVFSSAVQVAFSAGLGLNLPPGLMGGIL
jgi:putative tricarboxylic transport membrane protein